MWAINSVTNRTSPQQNIAFSDGEPIDAVRGPEGASFRLIVNGFGFLDFTDTGHQPGGPHYWQIIINGGVYWYDGQGALDLTIFNNGTYLVTGDGNELQGNLLPLPVTAQSNFELFDQMMAEHYIPYQNIPDEPGKTTAQIKALGLQYFPFSANSFELAMSLYDWTTADFTRMDFIRLFTYTGVTGAPLDKDSIAQAIWSADWPPYTPRNKDYMNSFFMTPANSLADVETQLNEQAEALITGVAAESDVINTALTAMPRTSVIAKPQLFSGQVAIANLGEDHFATYFEELPANSDPSLPPLQMPLAQAIGSFLAIGQTVTMKSFMSFTDSLKDAQHYSNGIVVIVSPPDGAVVWDATAFITPLSDGPNKIEYLFAPGTRFFVQDVKSVVIDGKPVTELYFQVVSTG